MPVYCRDGIMADAIRDLMRQIRKFKDITKQLWFRFARKPKQRVLQNNTLPFFDDPVNDNERLLDLQYMYYKNGWRNRELQALYIQLQAVAIRMVSKERKGNYALHYMTGFDVMDAAIDAASLMIEQYKKNDLIVTKSMTAYLYLQVRKVLYHETNARKFENYCMKYHIDFINKTPEQLEAIKAEYERENRK